MKRQGMTVTIKQLRHLADELESELESLNVYKTRTKKEIEKQRCSISIINKKGLSDTWELEICKRKK